MFVTNLQSLFLLKKVFEIIEIYWVQNEYIHIYIFFCGAQVVNDDDDESSDEEGSDSDSMEIEATQEMDVDPVSQDRYQTRTRP